MFLQFLTCLSMLTLKSVTASNAKPGCMDVCGNVSIPYPFGIGNENCYLSHHTKVVCNTSFSPPVLYASNFANPITTISLDGTMTVSLGVSFTCYYLGSEAFSNIPLWTTRLSDLYTFSHTRNMFTSIGCNTDAEMQDIDGKLFRGGCKSYCGSEGMINNGSCSGMGCCQTSIPKNLRTLAISLDSLDKHFVSGIYYNTCSYAFLADSKQFNFSYSNLKNFKGKEPRINNKLSFPAVLDWVVGIENCSQAQRNQTSYACRDNSECVESKNGPGYTCNCTVGYEGNPYLDGCTDIDECKNNPCEAICTNTPGSFKCSCPHGTFYDDAKDRVHCKNIYKFPILQISLGIGAAFLLLLVLPAAYWMYKKSKSRRIRELKHKFFIKNGGLLLEQRTSPGEGSTERSNIFRIEELEKATDNFNENRVLGKGGSGTVYKGMLPDGKIVAIKKSKLVDETHIAQFINELVILSDINHKNIVKVMGYCLETEVPLLVYEYISRGTLSEHLHGDNQIPSISWEDRLRIAKEIAGALSYLHSSLSIPIFHRDIKSSNILIDENFKAKVSDFGISRLVLEEKTHLSTEVQGTFGYLDPEYFHSGQFTDKSDVYGFGVVLVELLTGKKALCSIRFEDEKNLVIHFISLVKEGRVEEVLEAQIANEAKKEEINVVASLAKKYSFNLRI